jgi:RNA polymerase-interacting CarD/CdnL/TRCF family regulator
MQHCLKLLPRKKDDRLKEITVLKKNNPDYAQPKKAKAAKASKAAKSSKESKTSTSKKSETKAATSTTKTTNTTKETVAKKDVEKLSNVVTDLSQKVDQLTTGQEEQVKTLLTDIITQLKKQLGVNVDDGQSSEVDRQRTE